MTVIGFIVLVIVLVVIALLAERELYRRRNAALEESERGEEQGAIADRLVAQSSRWLGSVRETGENLVTPSYAKLSPQFRQWVDQEMEGNERLRAWLLSLPDEGFKALTNQIALFCIELNIDLAWLVNGELEIEPDIRQVTEEIIIGYCEACLKAVQIQNELTDFREYQNTLERLARRDHQEIGQQLLAKLREQELAEPASPDLVWASDEERRDYAMRTIREAAQQDREKFNRIWNDVMATAK